MTPIRYVYVAGPFSAADRSGVEANIARAIDAGEHLRRAGYMPFVPHLFDTWDSYHRSGYEVWMGLCLAWVERCDAVCVIAPSPGANRERAHAAARGIPVFEGVEALLHRRRP